MCRRHARRRVTPESGVAHFGGNIIKAASGVQVAFTQIHRFEFTVATPRRTPAGNRQTHSGPPRPTQSHASSLTPAPPPSLATPDMPMSTCHAPIYVAMHQCTYYTLCAYSSPLVSSPILPPSAIFGAEHHFPQVTITTTPLPYPSSSPPLQLLIPIPPALPPPLPLASLSFPPPLRPAHP